MSGSIFIFRDLPIIAGYVQIPPCRETEKTKTTSTAALSAIAGSEIVRLSLGSGKATGAKFGHQEWLRLPGIATDEWYSSDPVTSID